MNGRNLLALVLILVLAASAGYYFTSVKPLDRVMRLGLDLQGGMGVILEAVDTPEAPVTEDSMRQAVEVIRKRVDGLGVAEPVIQRSGERRIIVELPGVREAEQAVNIIGKPALLEFVAEPGSIQGGSVVEFTDRSGNKLKGQVVLTGANLKKAQESIDPSRGNVVALEFDAEGTQRFAEATAKNVGKIIWILLDRQVIQAPRVEDAIPSGKAIITGYETLEQAKEVRVLLMSGALPVKLEVRHPRIVSATLGMDSIVKSKQAGLIGVAGVVLFMLLYYRVAGLLADVALGIYLLLVLGTLVALKATLTLPGIAGIILSIGMAVDANVIIFERIKEELRGGKTVRSAVEAGHAHAFRTIVDSNVTTLIAAAVLFYFGTGPIRGFAVTLSLGILASMFTAVVITRLLIRLLIGAGLIKNTRLLFRV